MSPDFHLVTSFSYPFSHLSWCLCDILRGWLLMRCFSEKCKHAYFHSYSSLSYTNRSSLSFPLLHARPRRHFTLSLLFSRLSRLCLFYSTIISLRIGLLSLGLLLLIVASDTHALTLEVLFIEHNTHSLTQGDFFYLFILFVTRCSYVYHTTDVRNKLTLSLTHSLLNNLQIIHVSSRVIGCTCSLSLSLTHSQSNM